MVFTPWVWTRITMQMRIIRVGGKCHFWHFIPTPLSLDCIEPQPLGQSCTTLPTTLLWWAIKVDCQDTAWPSLLSHAKRERNWLPTRSHSRQLYGLSSKCLGWNSQDTQRHMVFTPWVWPGITIQIGKHQGRSFTQFKYVLDGSKQYSMHQICSSTAHSCSM